VRVAVYHANDDVRLEERPRPAIGPDELLLRVKASGVCGSDVIESYRMPKAPLVLGHEVAGVVEEAGERVTEFNVGERIVTTHHVPCDRCRYCLTDRHSVCKTLSSTTFDPGGFSEFVRLPGINVQRGTFHLPDEVSFEEGSFVEPLACAIRGQRVVGLRPGESVAILGSGISGILHLLLARATGAGRIFATDTHDYRVKSACALGADLALAAGPDVVTRIREANGGRGVDRVLVCTAARTALQQALELADNGGSILYFALPAVGETIDFPAYDIWKRGLSIFHTYAGPPADMRTALALLAARRLDVTPMITHRLALSETQEGFRLTALAGESLKVIIEPER